MQKIDKKYKLQSSKAAKQQSSKAAKQQSRKTQKAKRKAKKDNISRSFVLSLYVLVMACLVPRVFASPLLRVVVVPRFFLVVSFFAPPWPSLGFRVARGRSCPFRA
jgi:Flp pilus assembly protein TadB